MAIAEMSPSALEPGGSSVGATNGASQHPYRSVIAISLTGYVALALVLIGVGMLLTHPLNASVGRWDEHVNDYFARHRTSGWNELTKYATAAFNTLPVVLAAAIVVGFLGFRRRWHEAAFLTLALFVEITVFLSVTFIVARPRPTVVRLNSTPSTSSFPSGHTAAATVLFTGIAIIVYCCTTQIWARVFERAAGRRCDVDRGLCSRVSRAAPPNRRVDGCTARPVVPVRRRSRGAGVEPSPADGRTF